MQMAYLFWNQSNAYCFPAIVSPSLEQLFPNPLAVAAAQSGRTADLSPGGDACALPDPQELTASSSPGSPSLSTKHQGNPPVLVRLQFLFRYSSAKRSCFMGL